MTEEKEDKLEITVEDAKKFLKSKTVWFNTLMVLAFILNYIWGFDLDPETQATIVAVGIPVANVLLRFFTKKPLCK